MKGHARYARVDSIEGETVTLNFNHPLAGDELHFHVKVVALREPNEEELEHGHVHEDGASPLTILWSRSGLPLSMCGALSGTRAAQFQSLIKRWMRVSASIFLLIACGFDYGTTIVCPSAQRDITAGMSH